MLCSSCSQEVCQICQSCSFWSAHFAFCVYNSKASSRIRTAGLIDLFLFVVVSDWTAGRSDAVAVLLGTDKKTLTPTATTLTRSRREQDAEHQSSAGRSVKKSGLLWCMTQNPSLEKSQFLKTLGCCVNENRMQWFAKIFQLVFNWGTKTRCLMLNLIYFIV